VTESATSNLLSYLHVFRFGLKPAASRHGGLTSLCGATAREKNQKPTFNLNMAGHVFRFASKPPASRHGGLRSLCGAMATPRAKKPKQPRPGMSFVRFEAASTRINEFMWCDGNTTSQKKPKSDLHLARKENVLRTNRGMEGQ